MWQDDVDFRRVYGKREECVARSFVWVMFELQLMASECMEHHYAGTQ